MHYSSRTKHDYDQTQIGMILNGTEVERTQVGGYLTICDDESFCKRRIVLPQDPLAGRH